jgi:hypothetical protein
MLVFVVFSHYYPFYEGTIDKVGRVATAAVFLTLAIYARFSERWRKLWLIPFAYFVALTAISLDYYVGLSHWIMPLLGVEAASPPGWAIDKLESSLLSIIIVLVLNRLAGQSMNSLYIRRGRLWLGLLVGLAAFVVMTAAIIPVTNAYFKGENLTWAGILA